MRLPAQTIIAAFISFNSCATMPVEGLAQTLPTTPSIPRTWEDVAVSTMEIPLAQPERSAVHVTSEYYYRMPERTIYKSYPVFDPQRQPAGYIEWLRRQEPEISFDRSQLKTTPDWIKAGETVFEAPFSYNAWTTADDLQKQEWWKAVNPPVTRKGILPYVRYVVRTKGQVEVSSFSCAQCHIRVLDDGRVIAGAQGNYPLGRAQAVQLRRSNREAAMRVERTNYAVPWLGGVDPFVRLSAMSLEELAAGRELIPSGANSRPLTSPFSPAQIPDLIGVKDRRYFDHTALMQHRDIGDLMRYAAANQDASVLARHGDFTPMSAVPQPENRGRYSDAQLYALALYVYSLEPPTNPNQPTLLSRRGEKIFASEGCVGCHTAPLYTNNKLTPVAGFRVPAGDSEKYNILPVVVGTDATLALGTRRGTGYYKVPSLKGVWYRGPFEHNGSVATLEDWFDPKRLSDDYVPTGFRGYGLKTRPVKGHEFGLKLSADDKVALIAFLKTL